MKKNIVGMGSIPPQCEGNVAKSGKGGRLRGSAPSIKKVLSLFLSLVMLVSITAGIDFSSNAATSGDWEYEVLDDGTARITEYHGNYSSNLTVPSKLENYTVTEIRRTPFSDIGSQVLNITFPFTITYIDSSIFCNLGNLQTITADSNNQTYSTQDGVLFNKEKTELLEYPSANTRREYTVPNGVTHIEWGAFDTFRSGYLQTVNIPQSVTDMTYAFEDCRSLQNINVDSNNENYSSQDGILFDKKKRTIERYPAGRKNSVYEIPKGVQDIRTYGFHDCINLTNILIPNTVTVIGEYAFSGCDNLLNVVLPDSVSYLEHNAFDIYNLKSITINNPECELSEYCACGGDEFKIYGFRNSTAQKYAKENGYQFSAIEWNCDTDGHKYIDNKCFVCKSIEPNSVLHANGTYQDGNIWNTHQVKFGTSTFWYFTPQSDDYYTFFIDQSLSEDIYLFVCDNNGNRIFYSGESDNSYPWINSFYLKAGETYKFEVYLYDSYDCSGFLGLSVHIDQGKVRVASNIIFEPTSKIEIPEDYLTVEKNTDEDGHIWYDYDWNWNEIGDEHYPVFKDGDKLTVRYVDGSQVIYKYNSEQKSFVSGNDSIYNWAQSEDFSVIIDYENKELYINYGFCGSNDVPFELKSNEHIHNFNVYTTEKSTCTANGVKTYICTVCGETKTEMIPKTAHMYKTTVTKATTKKNGSIVTKCSVCGNVSKNTVIYYPKTITLSTTSYTYSGKVKKPSVTVKDSKGKKISSSNYTVSYSSGRKNVGQYTVTVKFKGNYSGTVKKTFTIKPKATTISKITAGKKAFTVKWKKQATQTTGYQIQYSTSSKFKGAKTITVSKNKTTSKKISKLKAKKKYYVHIRTYKIVKVNGKNTKIYSGWSKAKTVKTK